MIPLLRVTRAIRRRAKIATRLPRAKRLGLARLPPNYIFRPLEPGATVIDVGCGHEAELAQHLMATSEARVYAVDPTRKHAPYLKAIEERSRGKFTHLPLAVSAHSGTLRFHESVEAESGSIYTSHTNMERFSTRTYEVDAVTLTDLFGLVDAEQVALLKLDLEGAEYDLIDGLRPDDVAPFKQIFLEFHHHALPERSLADTSARVAALEAMGLQSFSLDDHNVLFMWT